MTPPLAPTPCLVCGARATSRGKCAEHQPPPWQGSTRKERLPANWAYLKRVVKARDKGICYLCRQAGADTVDHIVAGDNHSLANLAEVHDRNAPHCHRYKSSAEGVAARRARRSS